jgi:hypothetical protein
MVLRNDKETVKNPPEDISRTKHRHDMTLGITLKQPA